MIHGQKLISNKSAKN
ncbi:hypothetical protein RDI58_018703 [Solanum bulbocastanum]|uniref:Uncharacterized protein n=1 Tax=Solanum bulbocastanum TaxID=147425 RepID=A0AAN8YDA6_SOLBU